MLKRRRSFVFSILLFALTIAGLLLGLKPRVDSAAPSAGALWLIALALNLLWLILYLLVWRKNLTEARHNRWYLLGGGFLAVASVILLCVFSLSFGRS